MAEKTRFGTLLSYFRRSAGLSQEALAAQTGLSVRAISDLERGVNRSPRYATLDLLTEALPLSAQQRDLLKAAVQSEAEPPHISDMLAPRPAMPLPPTPLVGRQTEMSQALEMLSRGETRLLTLTGPSGVGKTRLALQIALDLAPEFQDGLAYVPLAAIREPSLVPGAIAQALKLHGNLSRSTDECVIAFLSNKHLLLYLDNLEQVLDCSPYIARLIANCPRLAVLATSRSPLRLRAEQELLLSPLPLDDAVALFCERFRVVRPENTLPHAEVADVCAQLDCLPLAIELAAMQGRTLSLTEIRKRLTRRFMLLRGGARDLPARQQTMQDAIGWSYELLSAPQRTCFRRLGVFVGGWTFEAAEAVCWEENESEPEERLLALAALVEASLVQTESAPNGLLRFSMLELIRAYALDHLEKSGELEVCEYRHAAYYARLASTAEAMFESGPVDPDQDLVQEFANVQAALQRMEIRRQLELGLRLTGFTRLWHVTGQSGQAVAWLERILDLDASEREQGKTGVPLSLRIQRLVGLGRVRMSMRQIERAKAAALEALRLAEEIEDEAGIARAWANLGMISQASGRLSEAEEASQQFLLHAGRTRDIQLKIHANVNLAELDRSRGEFSRARVYLEQALAYAEAQRRGWDIAIINTLLGKVAFEQREFRLARARYRESLPRLAAFNSPTWIAWCLESCAMVLCAEGRAFTAARLCAHSANLRELAGTPLPDGEHAALEQVLVKLRAALGERVFEQAWQQGVSLARNEAIQMTLSELGQDEALGGP